MISRIKSYIVPAIVLAIVLVVGQVAFADNPRLVIAVVGGILVAAIGFAGHWAWRKRKSTKASHSLTQMVSHSEGATVANTGDVDALKGRLEEALTAIKASRLGRKGSEALYELPWYMIIGNPAAGKSSALLNSGLHFPFADHKGSVLEGIGGTRNCDWYFTTEGILLDTAGRYSVEDKDRKEWLSFLGLLRKHRPRAPINGIIIAASVAELTGNPPEFAIELAKKLRQRIQELTDRLEVIAPVYVVFTKADLISGFGDFFRTLDPSEREKVWGSTFAFQPKGNVDVVSQFDAYFDELAEGLKEMSLAQMAINRGNAQAPGLLTLPLEFKGLKASLRTFLTALFEDNPYQYRPVVRGFYFTSAVQEVASVHRVSDDTTKRFGLTVTPAMAVKSEPSQKSMQPAANESEAEEAAPAKSDTQLSRDSYFLLDLFRKVIFADRELVRQYSSASHTRQRYIAVFVAASLLGTGLGGWAWSYTNNRQLISNVEADLQKVVEIQRDRIDLQSRLEALNVLQDRLQQLQRYKHDHPLMLGFGLYQGDILEARLRQEYLQGMAQVMLKPVVEQMEAFLTEVSMQANELTLAGTKRPGMSGGGGVYQTSSPTNVEDAYNALKAYLMLGSAQRVEPVHLSDQLTRFWRHWLEANRGVMDREAMARSAERLMSFYIAQSASTDWPTVENKFTLIDDTRRALSGVMSGLPARDRVYAEIKARAATRYPSVTVANLLADRDNKVFSGSYAISGTFSREAWEGYVKQAIRDAANKELKSTDWVLQASRSDDLTLSGSPEHIQKELEQLYTQEYITEWKKFLQGITVSSFGTFAEAGAVMNQFGDPQHSPMRHLLESVYRQTSWDNPSLINEGLKNVKTGWAKLKVWEGDGDSPAEQKIGVLPTGPVGREFSGIARLMLAQDNAPPLLQGYLEVLSKIRTRLNAIQTQGDPGPGSRELILQTLDGSASSELSSGLTLVDEQMLSSMEDSQRRTLRPLLLWPMIQTYNALIPVTHAEINRVWQEQVYQPFQLSLAGKYPFATEGQIEATTSEISEIFGPQGAISQFATQSLGPLVIRRGNSLTSKQWADVGLTLSPSLMANFSQWVAPLGHTAEGGAMAIFQILPGSATGFSEYTLLIGDQQLRYRNTPAQWSNFAWDSSKPNQTAKISVVTYDGRTQEIQSFVGQNALGQLIQSAKSRQNADGTYELQWSNGEWSVPVSMKIVSNPKANADGSQRQGLNGSQLPQIVVGTQESSESVL